MNLNQKFLYIMKACSYVQKLGENTFHKYKYATAADVFEKVNAALVEQGIITIAKPSIIASEQVTNTKGNLETRITIQMNVELIDSITGERLTLSGYGSGQDTGDKAIMKAQTAALKYTWMLSLNISTGDDPEADATVDQRTAVTLPRQNGQRREASSETPPPVQAPAQPATAAATPTQQEPLPTVLPPTPAPESTAKAVTGLASLEQLKVMFALAKKCSFGEEDMRNLIYKQYNVSTSRDLTKKQAAEVIDFLRTHEEQMKAAG